MFLKKSKEERKTETLFDELCENPIFTKDEASALNDQLGLDQIELGFLMSRRHFDFWAQIMLPYSKEGQGLWSFQFHPLSGHMIHGVMRKRVTKTLAMTKCWDLFRWNVNGLFMKDWIRFNQLGFHHVVYCKMDVKNVAEFWVWTLRESYINVKNSGFSGECDFFIGWDANEKKRVYMRTRVGGGRCYSPDHAQPYRTSAWDINPDNEIESKKTMLCCARHFLEEESYFSKDLLPMDLFKVILALADHLWLE